MSVFNGRKVFFIHIPKTAGMTFTSVLSQFFSKEYIFPSYNPLDLKEKFKLNENSYQLFAGHFGYEFVEKFEKRPITVAFIRNPLERLFSHYYYYRNWPLNKTDELPWYDRFIADLAKNYSFQEFIEIKSWYVKKAINNIQTRQLAGSLDLDFPINHQDKEKYLKIALENLKNIDFVGVVENFDLSLRLFFNMFNLGEVPEINSINVNQKRPRLELEDCKQLSESLDDMIGLDTVVYKLALELFQDKLSSAGFTDKIKARIG